ncbi:MAG: DUF255 domain-containing protein [Gammaproteobacteria bacterium]|nr:DUF255 domain-containing protein [Gammaproteobacteria bacterium]
MKQVIFITLSVTAVIALVIMKIALVTALFLGLFVPLNTNAALTNYHVERPMEIQEKLTAAYLAKGPQYRPRTEHLKADGTPVYINRLILEDSPYLLQHAHNPVDWYAWDSEAFELAKRENKPVFLSIGYSTCHWCHVMERESFENPAIAKLLNEHFVAIKVDRESHPDVDEVYMTAVMLMTGHGGWPMSSFLTPDGKPFFSGTYYPPEQFGSILLQIQQLWESRRDEVLHQAERVAAAVEESNDRQGKAKTLDPEIVTKATQMALRNYDELLGGFSLAPKFPHEPLLHLLLNQAERRQDTVVLDALEVTLDAMARGGIYDQVGGGFHRYSTDNEWLVPHFEKMLYNQAQLSRVYLLAWRLTGKESYRRTATQTFDYVLREMTAPNGGFYSATDADSEGREGAFFVWTPEQIRKALPEKKDAELAIRLYGVTAQGNFEGHNILHLQQGLEEFAEQEKLALDELYQQVDRINRVLREKREAREHPLRDDKIVTAWNGMMLSAFAQAADLLGSTAYREAAERNGEFLWEHNRKSSGRLWRVHLDGDSSIPATQEDYAYLAEGFLHLYDLTADTKWLARARELTDAMLERFIDRDGGFYMNEVDAGITAMRRPKDDGGDNAIPSGSSVALRSMQMLWQRTGQLDYRNQANALIGSFAGSIERQPISYAYMLTAIDDLRNGELSAHGYAAQGGIHLAGSLQTVDGNKSLLKVDIEIPEGWHINSHQPASKELVPTRLKLAEDADNWQMAPVTYPKHSMQKLAFQSEPLAVYEEKLQLQALVEKKTQKDDRPLSVELSLQACNNQVCLPPEQVRLRISQVQQSHP